MHRILKLLDETTIVKEYEIMDFKLGEKYYYLKGRVELVNETELFFREYVSEKERIYSYHWQEKEGKMICRWDNAPHHKEVKSYPHHKHTPEIKDSNEITLEEIIENIKERIRKEKK